MGQNMYVAADCDEYFLIFNPGIYNNFEECLEHINGCNVCKNIYNSNQHKHILKCGEHKYIKDENYNLEDILEKMAVNYPLYIFKNDKWFSYSPETLMQPLKK